MRLLSGLFSSVTVANFGGTIADLYPSHATGPAMSLFLWAATCGSPMGYFLFAFVAQYRGWRDVLWAIMGVSSGLWILMTVVLLVCGETRHSVLLMKKAERERKRTGRDDIEVPEEMKQRGVKQLFKVALTRPFRFLGTEAISKSRLSLSRVNEFAPDQGLQSYSAHSTMATFTAFHFCSMAHLALYLVLRAMALTRFKLAFASWV